VQDCNGNQPLKINRSPKGSVEISLSLPERNTSMCGWLFKFSEALMSKTWKKRWFVLINGTLQYYNSQVALDKPKNIIVCNEVISLKKMKYKNKEALVISFINDMTKSEWFLSFNDSDSEFINNMWIKKLLLSCPNAENNFALQNNNNNNINTSSSVSSNNNNNVNAKNNDANVNNNNTSTINTTNSSSTIANNNNTNNSNNIRPPSIASSSQDGLASSPNELKVKARVPLSKRMSITLFNK
jgi:hypothetical protein